MKATNIKATGKKGSGWSVTATIGLLPYQDRFDSEPTKEQVEVAIKSFEINYAQLNDSEKEPVIVKPHHSEV